MTTPQKQPPTDNYVYAHVVNTGTQTVIQYWLFYAFNNGPLNDHQGDIEVVEIFLDSTTDTPKTALYSQHFAGQNAGWGDVEKVDNHPVVYVAQGSHANYFRPYQGKIGLENDIVGNDGITINPIDLAIVMLGEHNSHPPEQGWLDYGGRLGYWGTQEEVALGRAGPYGPVFNQDGTRWAQPQAYLDTTFGVGNLYFIAALLVANFLLLFIIYIVARAGWKTFGIVKLKKKRLTREKILQEPRRPLTHDGHRSHHHNPHSTLPAMVHHKRFIPKRPASWAGRSHVDDHQRNQRPPSQHVLGQRRIIIRLQQPVLHADALHDHNSRRTHTTHTGRCRNKERQESRQQTHNRRNHFTPPVHPNFRLHNDAAHVPTMGKGACPRPRSATTSRNHDAFNRCKPSLRRKHPKLPHSGPNHSQLGLRHWSLPVPGRCNNQNSRRLHHAHHPRTPTTNTTDSTATNTTNTANITPTTPATST